MSRRPARTPRERRPRPVYNPRPFAGEAYEADLVALREVVPSATAPVKLRDGREIVVATVLPLAWPALKRRGGEVVLALQVAPRSGDVGLDLGHALTVALESEEGTGVSGLDLPPADTVRFSDLVEPGPWEITVHPGFDWWVSEQERASADPELEASLAQANTEVVPTARLASVDAAYWCAIGERRHLRWALPGDEEKTVDALARLYVSGGIDLGDDARFIGTFRALGVLVPVWDLPGDCEAEDCDVRASSFATRLAAALEGGPLTSEERRARSGVLGRQITLR